MRSMLTSSAAALAMLASSLGGACADGLAGELKIFLGTSNPVPRAAMEELVATFQEQNPNLDIELRIIGHDAYKTQIRSFLTANAPDVAGWYAANRMRPFVEAGLFEDISDLWADPEIGENLASTRGALTIGGKQWGVPYTYYHWGIYYRKDVFDELGLSEPATWEEEKANCRQILDTGRKCYAIGTKSLWTAGSWFDYLNMRTNGFDFHMKLLTGKASWQSDPVRETFAHWRELIDMGAFTDDHRNNDWRDALALMSGDAAAASLTGNFAVAPLREAGLTDDQLDFYQFVEIAPGREKAEDAPTDTFHIPSRASNKENAREFLRFAVSPEVQTWLNDGAHLGQLPINARSSVDDDKFLEQGFEMLSRNAPGSIAQFLDRDAPAEMTTMVLEDLREFMIDPDALDGILARLDRAQERIYN